MSRPIVASAMCAVSRQARSGIASATSAAAGRWCGKRGALPLQQVREFRPLHHLYRRPETTRPVLDEACHSVVGDQSSPGLSATEIGVKNVAKRDIAAGAVVFHEAGPISKQRSMHSLQIGVDSHCEIQGEGRFTSHSFEPNCRIRVVEMSSHPIDFVALRDIQKGETLSIDYTCTEWELAEPFLEAQSGQPCQGFKHLPLERRLQLLRSGFLPPHILQLWLLEQAELKQEMAPNAQASALNGGSLTEDLLASATSAAEAPRRPQL
eukprot:TRINITY_DN24300_c0_g1_i1.p1 TRINITY_DN24300_c0_g1~~TRINITY_DN24300_c0_g1_i1.p1  ORF type:complete len:266 (-),score=67.42 TRINITY_DN24300_c0_g1_i1:248-1045(-)